MNVTINLRYEVQTAACGVSEVCKAPKRLPKSGSLRRFLRISHGVLKYCQMNNRENWKKADEIWESARNCRIF